MPHLLRVRRVDDNGLAVVTLGDRPVDVCIDGRRVWTFWTQRDTTPVGSPAGRGPWPVRHASWPKPLRRHLTATPGSRCATPPPARVSFDRDVALGSGEGPILVQNKLGVDLGIDKSGRLVPTFAGRSDDDIAALLDATEAVIEALRSAGVEPFVAYGTLLGAVREGAVLGHDSDADLGYVSRSHEPGGRRPRVLRDPASAPAGTAGRRRATAAARSRSTSPRPSVTRGLDVFGGLLRRRAAST